MATTLDRWVSMTSEGIRMDIDANIRHNPVRIKADPDFSWRNVVLPNSGLGYPEGTLSWGGWEALQAGSWDDFIPTGNVASQREAIRFTPHVRLVVRGDLTIVHVEPGRDPIWALSGTGISFWTPETIADRLPQIDWAAGESNPLDDVSLSIVPPGINPGGRVDKASVDVPTELADALTDLAEIVEESEEKGFALPTDPARRLANLLLRSMYSISQRRFEVYPMPKGEIAIDCNDGHGQRIVVFCEPAGSLRCLTNHNGKRDGYRDSDPQSEVGAFIREALEAFL